MGEKILTEEILSDDELEEVSGGGTRQICGAHIMTER